MWIQFFLENVHFALNLFAALVFFSTMWLYFDAWVLRKNIKESLKIIGLLFLTLSFVIHATFLESTILTGSIIGENLNQTLVVISRTLGYLFLILGLVIDPLQAHPNLKGFLIIPSGVIVFQFLPLTFPILAVITAFLYLRRATVGLEDHLKPVSLVFYILAIYELVSLSSRLQGTTNVYLFKLVAPFGPIWHLEHVILLLAVLVLGRWLYYYLLKRLQTQLFIILTCAILVIFLLITVTFTGLLLKNLQDETLIRLETDVKVLNYAVESKKQEVLSDAEVFAKDPEVISAVEEKTKGGLIIKQDHVLFGRI